MYYIVEIYVILRWNIKKFQVKSWYEHPKCILSDNAAKRTMNY